MQTGLDHLDRDQLAVEVVYPHSLIHRTHAAFAEHLHNAVWAKACRSRPALGVDHRILHKVARTFERGQQGLYFRPQFPVAGAGDV